MKENHKSTTKKNRKKIDSQPSSVPRQMLIQAGLFTLEATGENLKRDGIQDTPLRFAKAMEFLTQGYQKTPLDAVGSGVFPAEGNGLVSVRNIEFYSLCEHHMLPFWGQATVSYYPGKKILGLSKIPRLIEIYSRRFQVQERLTQQVVDAVREVIQPRAVSCQIKACHLCMMMRGVEKQQSETLTEAHWGLEKLSDLERKRILKSLQGV